METLNNEVAAGAIVGDGAWLGELRRELFALLTEVFAQARSRFTAFAYIGALLAEPGDRLRAWLARFAGREDVAFALEGCTGWRYVAEELAAAGITAHVAEPADTAFARGRKRHAKTDKTDSRHLRELLAEGRLPECRIPPRRPRPCHRSRPPRSPAKGPTPARSKTAGLRFAPLPLPAMIRSRPDASRAPAAPLRGRSAPPDPADHSQKPAAIRARERSEARPQTVTWPPRNHLRHVPMQVSALGQIDGDGCPVVMLTGEYLTTPDAGLRTADRIRNASFIEMKEIGHFPMSENYPAFRGYLLRALELLRAKATV